MQYHRTMIRFSCTNCQREYYLADALAHLPLLCKGCGHRLEVPNPTSEGVVIAEEPKPAFERSIAAPVHLTSDEKYNVREEHVSTADDSEVDLFLSPDVRKKPSVPIEGSAAAPVPAPRPPVQKGSSPEPAAIPNSNRKALGLLIDIAIAVILLALGTFVGEAIAGRSTGEILRRAGSAPKFPPTDLLIWLASVLLPGLAYAWLGTRGGTVGGWLKRR